MALSIRRRRLEVLLKRRGQYLSLVASYNSRRAPRTVLLFQRRDDALDDSCCCWVAFLKEVMVVIVSFNHSAWSSLLDIMVLQSA